MRINILQRGAGKLFLRAKESQHINTTDREVVEALERLFVIDLPKIKAPKIDIPSPPNFDPDDFEVKFADYEKQLDVYEDVATDIAVIKLLRTMSLFFLLAIIMRIVAAIVGGNDIDSISVFCNMITSFFFGFLFIMLHLETNNQSLILLFLAYASLMFGLW